MSNEGIYDPASSVRRFARRIKCFLKQMPQRLRAHCAKLVYSFPPLSRLNPRRRIVYLRQHCEEVSDFGGNGSVDRDWCLEVQPGETVHREDALSIDEADAARFRKSALKFQGGLARRLPDVLLACLHKATFESNGALVTLPDRQIVFESALSENEVLERTGALDRVLWPSAQSLQGDYFHFSHPDSNAYYHWIFEVLPKLMHFEGHPLSAGTKLLVSGRLNSFQRQSLALAGVEQTQIHEAGRGNWKVERLYFCEIPAPWGNPSPAAVSWLRKTFLKPNRDDSARPSSKIYITRRDAPSRRIVNEDEITSYLKNEGFKVVCLSEHSFAEQIAIFQDAVWVVAPHGAGLTNMVFAPKGAILVEIFGDNYINGCYWALANLCGHTHAFLSVPTDTLNYVVPVERLAMLIAKLKPLQAFLPESHPSLK